MVRAVKPGRGTASKSGPTKPGLHSRNRFRVRYDLPALTETVPELGPFLQANPLGEPTIDFADPRAVKLLNQALLAHHYGIRGWDIPEGYLCPPIPGRADHLHHLADLLAGDHDQQVPQGAGIRVLDIGVGANCVYPLVGHAEYGWRFLGSDIDQGALDSARRMLAQNPQIEAHISLRRQQAGRILKDLLTPEERFELSLCNPPFHDSPGAAREGSARKWRNLGRGGPSAPVLNFGGKGGELWCPGGEAAFLTQMIRESVGLAPQGLWFSSLVSKDSTLPALRKVLREVGAVETRILPMAQGQKRSRILAWTFHPLEVRRAWLIQRRC